MQRAKRQQKILGIIANKEIDTQEELCDELNKSNFRVTQATISRDVKELKLYKVAGVQKKYRYASLDVDDGVNNRMTSLYKGCVLSINSANNLILVKTMRGNGSTVGVFVDSLKINEIIGSVAGDDTLLIVVDSNEHTPVVVTLLQEYLS